MKFNTADIREKINELDLLTKQGKRLEVLNELKKLSRNKISSEFLPALARIANRNSAYYLAMYFLFGEIQKDREGLKMAPPKAYAVFANSLLNLGAIEEATECAAKAGDNAESRLLRAFIGMAKWDYSDALSHLRKYVVSTELTDYQRSVGELNLSAALLSLGQYEEAEAHLKDLIVLLSENPNGRLLLGNCFELLSQIEINKQNYIGAARNLNKGREILSEFPGRYLLYLKKWEGVLALTRDPSSLEAKAQLENVKKESLSLRNW